MTDGQRQRVLPGLIILVSLGLVLAWQWLPWKYEEVDQGFSDEARRNPFLAASLFLQGQGVSVSSGRSLRRLDDLPPPHGATLILHSNEGLSDGERVEAVWQWVEEGGHLILNANTYTDVSTGENRNRLLEDMSLRLYPVEEEGDSDGEHHQLRTILDWFNLGASECSDEDDLLDLPLEEGEEPLQVSIRSGAFLETDAQDASLSVTNSDGAQLLSYFIGEGRVTVSTDLAMWTNRSIACHDHAHSLSLLTGSGEGEVVFLYHIRHTSMWGLLWNAAALGICLSLLWLGLWLWWRGQRFGPLLVSDYSRRRSLAEHLQASAMFAWRNRDISPEVDALRQRIHQQLERRHAGFSQLDETEQYSIIARMTQIPTEQVAWAMAEGLIEKPRHLVETVRRLQLIRNRL